MESSSPFPRSHNDGGRRTPYATPAFQLVLHAPARSVAEEDVGVENGPVDGGGGDRVVGADPSPLVTDDVARKDGRPLSYRGELAGRGDLPVPG